LQAIFEVFKPSNITKTEKIEGNQSNFLLDLKVINVNNLTYSDYNRNTLNETHAKLKQGTIVIDKIDISSSSYYINDLLLIDPYIEMTKGLPAEFNDI